MAKKKTSTNKYKDHPFASDFEVLRLAFIALEMDHMKTQLAVRDRANVKKTVYDQLHYEETRLMEVKVRVYKLLMEDAKKGNSI